MKHNETNTVETVAHNGIHHTTHDFAIALLIVSLVINLFFLVGWVALRVTSAYDSEVAVILFTR